MALNPYKTLQLLPREPLAPNVDLSPRWRIFFEQFQRMLGNISGLDWGLIDKTNSTLADIAQRQHSLLTEVKGYDNGEVADADHVYHVSKAQINKWDNLTSSDNEALFWLLGG